MYYNDRISEKGANWMFELNLLGYIFLGVCGAFSLLLFIGIIRLLAVSKLTTGGTSFFRFITILILIVSLIAMLAVLLSRYTILQFSIINEGGALAFTAEGAVLVSFSGLGGIVDIFLSLVGLICVSVTLGLSILALLICGIRRHKAKKQVGSINKFAESEAEIVKEIEELLNTNTVEEKEDDVIKEEVVLDDEIIPYSEPTKSDFNYVVYYSVPDSSKSEVYDRIVELDSDSTTADEIAQSEIEPILEEDEIIEQAVEEVEIIEPTTDEATEEDEEIIVEELADVEEVKEEEPTPVIKSATKKTTTKKTATKKATAVAKKATPKKVTTKAVVGKKPATKPATVAKAKPQPSKYTPIVGKVKLTKRGKGQDIQSYFEHKIDYSNLPENMEIKTIKKD